MTSVRPKTTWHEQSVESVLGTLETTVAQGLSNEDATEKLNLIGPNEIAPAESTSLGRLLLHQFSNFMILLLVAAAIISGLIGDVIDTIAIIVILVLNAAVGVLQEFRAQRAIAALRKMSALSARVIRDGKKFRLPLAILCLAILS